MVTQTVTGHKNPAGKKSSSDEPRQIVARRNTGIWRIAGAVIALFFAGQTLAEEVTRGPVTNLPIPRYVSMKAAEGNVRRGPSLSHRIDWVFTRRDMPLRVTAEHGHWRRVQDRDGQGGWVHYALLSGARTVLVERDMLTLHARPDNASPVVAALEAGVIARLGQCEPGWCRLTAGGFRGWAETDALWGVIPGEIRD
ncbi:SH3 domain-containing protein [Aestuariivita boseongensis]|uniref:SH3 domain-containing protein n=1 Tax=Aestuariivita boseongensis TaxID=1470562 RepID=UPI0009E56001|nr:SH3 domain-containing protein [Aestuariivita boseongensis]